MTELSPWRGVVNGVLYGVLFDRVLDETVVERVVRYLVERPLYDQPVADTVATLRAGLDSGAPLNGTLEVPHGEQDVRDFLTRVLAGLDRVGPVPEPRYRWLDRWEWDGAETGTPIARINLDWKDISDRLERHFHHDNGSAVLVLRLVSGDRIAIVDDWRIPWNPDPPFTPGESLLLYAGPGSPADVLAAFTAASGLSAEEITPIPPP